LCERMKRPTAFLELESFALNNNAERDVNTANGAFAPVANTTGERNTATGDNALSSNNTGNRNTAIGNAALRLNTTGTDNTAISGSVCPREPIYFSRPIRSVLRLRLGV
jgi:hypothetical protein